ncbi:glycosyltransferase family 4 protein [uncultured Bacteroides sp.]|jgi:glycosyltransferase involved in cell wall biosynthesis|uniref:glycosyltransferase family 4 protein n=1 Tax=uncultured Bacteroides sp. TaxID=162156 RepID=UPI000339A2F9|nr:glycosyltransferase family 4 protein [uncultured Bacteroides sp.]CDA84741.1 glycosyltransferase group 1 family protein [Bacteroides sp. CAG:754]
MSKYKIIRACTVPQSLGFVTGMLPDLQKKYEVVLLSSSGPEWKEVHGLYPDVKCMEVNMERRISPIKDIKSLWQLWLTFCKEKPKMVHSMTPKAGLLCMLAARMAGVPVRVHTFTGLVFPTSVGLKKKILMATDWLTCACATHIIPEGEGVKNDLLNNGITKKPIKVLGYGNCRGIDLERFDKTLEVMEQAEKLRKKSVCTFIVVGRIVGDKGINELVEAFVKLNKENSATRLILVGCYEDKLDPLKSETLNLIKNCSAIEAVGQQKDVRPWFAAADVAVLASYREGFPNVVIEAGAMGLPQIVTDINGAREIIIEGENGTVIPSKSVDALYNAMKHMLDADYRDGLANNARKLIASRYEQGFVRKCLCDFYDKIL